MQLFPNPSNTILQRLMVAVLYCHCSGICLCAAHSCLLRRGLCPSPGPASLALFVGLCLLPTFALTKNLIQIESFLQFGIFQKFLFPLHAIPTSVFFSKLCWYSFTDLIPQLEPWLVRLPEPLSCSWCELEVEESSSWSRDLPPRLGICFCANSSGRLIFVFDRVTYLVRSV